MQDDQIEPGKEESQCSKLPLPGRSTPALIAEPRHKDHGENEREDLHIVLSLCEVLFPATDHLHGFH